MNYRPIGLYWNFAPYNNIFDHDLHPYAQRDQNFRDDWARHTVIINNFHTNGNGGFHYNQGPKAADVQQHTGHQLTPVSLSDRQQPGRAQMDNRNQLNVYRPQVQQQQDRAVQPQHYNRAYQAAPRGGEANPNPAHQQPAANAPGRDTYRPPAPVRQGQQPSQGSRIYPTIRQGQGQGRQTTPQKSKGQKQPAQPATPRSKNKG